MCAHRVAPPAVAFRPLRPAREKSNALATRRPRWNRSESRPVDGTRGGAQRCPVTKTGGTSARIVTFRGRRSTLRACGYNAAHDHDRLHANVWMRVGAAADASG